MANIALNLTKEEVKGIISVLGELPTKSGAYMLLIKINSQLQQQVDNASEPTSPPIP